MSAAVLVNAGTFEASLDRLAATFVLWKAGYGRFRSLSPLGLPTRLMCPSFRGNGDPIASRVALG